MTVVNIGTAQCHGKNVKICIWRSLHVCSGSIFVAQFFAPPSEHSMTDYAVAAARGLPMHAMLC